MFDREISAWIVVGDVVNLCFLQAHAEVQTLPIYPGVTQKFRHTLGLPNLSTSP